MSVIGKIAKLIGVNEVELKKAIDEKTDFQLPSVTVFTSSELEANNVSIASKATKESISSLADALGVSGSDAEAIKVAVAAKFSDVDSKKTIEELTIKTTKAEDEIAALTGKLTEEQATMKSLKTNIAFDSIIPEGYSLGKDDIKTLFSANSKIDFDETGLFLVDDNGNKLVDNKQKVVRPTKESMVAFLDSKGLKAEQPDGKPPVTPINRDSSEKTGKYAAISNMEGLNKYAKANNININSATYNQLVSAKLTEDPNFGKE